MAAGPTNPTEYIQGHLTHLTVPHDAGFWSLNLDSVVTALVVGIVSFGFLWAVVRKATSGVPSKTQAFVELAVGFVNNQTKDIYHGSTKLVAPLSLTVFVFVVMM